MLVLGNQPGANRLTSAEALSIRVSKSNSESPAGGVLVSLFQIGKSFDSGGLLAWSTSTRLFSTEIDVEASMVCVVEVVCVVVVDASVD